jgi:hypothetical protein
MSSASIRIPNISLEWAIDARERRQLADKHAMEQLKPRKLQTRYFWLRLILMIDMEINGK